MSLADSLIDVVERIYCSAIEPRRWSEALSSLTSVLGGSQAALIVETRGSDARCVLAAINTDAPTDVFAEYTRYYLGIDLLRNTTQRLPLEAIITDVAVVTPAVRRSECFNDFYVRQNLARFIGTYPVNDEEYVGSIAVFRQNDRPYETEQIAFFERVAPHLTRSLAIGNRLRATEREADALQDVIDAFTTGVFVLDQKLHVRRMNSMASAMVATGDGIALAHGTLVLRDGRAASSLRQGMQQIRAVDTPPAPFVIRRPSGASSYVAVVAPRRNASGLEILLLVRDSAAELRSVKQYLRSQYALTKAEADLAVAVADGMTVGEYAETHSISTETARTHLKRTLRKTETHRQAELVRLVLAAGTNSFRCEDDVRG